MIDRQLSTRDIGELSGVGRQAPVMATFSIIAIASMVGIIPTIGFVAKEGALTALLHEAAGRRARGASSRSSASSLGSVLTAAYGIRFLWGAFWTKRDATGAGRAAPSGPTRRSDSSRAPVLLSGLTLVGGLRRAAARCGASRRTPTPAPASTPGVRRPRSRATWRSGTASSRRSGISLGTIAASARALFWLTRSDRWDARRRMLPFTAADVYNATLRGVARARRCSPRALTQRGSLPGLRRHDLRRVRRRRGAPRCSPAPTWQRAARRVADARRSSSSRRS